MTPALKGDLIMLSNRLFWRIVEKWKAISKDLEARGLIDNHSRWVFTMNEQGEVIIFNKRVTAEVYNILNLEFFAEFDKKFNENWTKVVRISSESGWERYTPSSGPSSRTNLKQFGWKMNGSIFHSRADRKDVAGIHAGPKPLSVDVKGKEFD